MKDATYHKAAIEYNQELASAAESLAERLEHEEVARWSRAVAKQHRFHENRHEKALTKLKEGEKVADEPMAVGPTLSEEQAEYAEAHAKKQETSGEES